MARKASLAMRNASIVLTEDEFDLLNDDEDFCNFKERADTLIGSF